VIRSQAVLVAIGINWEGRRCVLGVEMANRESQTSWKELLEKLLDRGLRGVQLVVSDDHSGLRKALREVLPQALWRRCYVHFLRNALDYLPRKGKGDDDCLTELRWIYERRTGQEARQDLAGWVARWAARYPKLCRWGGGKHRRNAYVLRAAAGASQTPEVDQPAGAAQRRAEAADIGHSHFFPNTASCLRLTRALAVEFTKIGSKRRGTSHGPAARTTKAASAPRKCRLSFAKLPSGYAFGS